MRISDDRYSRERLSLDLAVGAVLSGSIEAWIRRSPSDTSKCTLRDNNPSRSAPNDYAFSRILN